MRLFVSLCFCLLLFSCQKEVSTSKNPIIASGLDSLAGKWKYKYDYRLVTTQADTTVVTDSVYGGRYDPFSYFEVKPDSTYKWWRSESTALPMYGWGSAGRVQFINSIRSIRLREESYTTDDFINTTPSATPSTGPVYRIKYISNDSLVLYFRVIGSATTYWWWHDVYVK